MVYTCKGKMLLIMVTSTRRRLRSVADIRHRDQEHTPPSQRIMFVSAQAGESWGGGGGQMQFTLQIT